MIIHLIIIKVKFYDSMLINKKYFNWEIELNFLYRSDIL